MASNYGMPQGSIAVGCPSGFDEQTINVPGSDYRCFSATGTYRSSTPAPSSAPSVPMSSQRQVPSYGRPSQSQAPFVGNVYPNNGTWSGATSRPLRSNPMGFPKPAPAERTGYPNPNPTMTLPNTYSQQASGPGPGPGSVVTDLRTISATSQPERLVVHLQQLLGQCNLGSLVATHGISQNNILRQDGNGIGSAVKLEEKYVDIQHSWSSSSTEYSENKLKKVIDRLFTEENFSALFQAVTIDKDAVINRIVYDLLVDLKSLRQRKMTTIEATDGEMRSCEDSVICVFDCGSKNYNLKRVEYMSICTSRDSKICFGQMRLKDQKKWQDEIELNCRLHLQAIGVNVSELAGMQPDQADEVFKAIEFTGQCIKFTNQKMLQLRTNRSSFRFPLFRVPTDPGYVQVQQRTTHQQRKSWRRVRKNQ